MATDASFQHILQEQKTPRQRSYACCCIRKAIRMINNVTLSCRLEDVDGTRRIWVGFDGCREEINNDFEIKISFAALERVISNWYIFSHYLHDRNDRKVISTTKRPIIWNLTIERHFDRILILSSLFLPYICIVSVDWHDFLFILW